MILGFCVRFFHSWILPTIIFFLQYFSKIIGAKNNGRKNPATMIHKALGTKIIFMTSQG